MCFEFLCFPAFLVFLEFSGIAFLLIVVTLDMDIVILGVQKP